MYVYSCVIVTSLKHFVSSRKSVIYMWTLNFRLCQPSTLHHNFRQTSAMLENHREKYREAVLMTVFSHDQSSWPHLVMIPRSISQYSIKHKELTLGALFGPEDKLLLRTSVLYFLLISRRCRSSGTSTFYVISRKRCTCNQLLTNYQVELQVLEIKPRTASQGNRSPSLPTLFLKLGI
jgi:hypothetical protein